MHSLTKKTLFVGENRLVHFSGGPEEIHVQPENPDTAPEKKTAKRMEDINQILAKESNPKDVAAKAVNKIAMNSDDADAFEKIFLEIGKDKEFMPELGRMFGVDPKEFGRMRLLIGLGETSLAVVAIVHDDRTIQTLIQTPIQPRDTVYDVKENLRTYAREQVRNEERKVKELMQKATEKFPSTRSKSVTFDIVSTRSSATVTVSAGGRSEKIVFLDMAGMTRDEKTSAGTIRKTLLGIANNLTAADTMDAPGKRGGK